MRKLKIKEQIQKVQLERFKINQELDLIHKWSTFSLGVATGIIIILLIIRLLF